MKNLLLTALAIFILLGVGIQLNKQQVSAQDLGVANVSNIVQTAPTTGANTKTNPFFTNLADGTNSLTAALSAYGSAPTGTEVMGVNAFVTGSSLSNQTVNETQIGSTTYGLGSTTMSASAPTVLATDQGNPCFNSNSSPSSFAVTTSGTTLTQLIALSAGKKIFVCSIVLTSVSGTTPNYELETGTATNCGSTTVVLVGPSATVVAGTIVSYPNAFIVPASSALCYKMGTVTPVFNVSGTYVQQ